MQATLENPMVLPQINRHMEPFALDKPTCDCGSIAKLTIHGVGRCYSCGEDEGVTVLYEYRRYGA